MSNNRLRMLFFIFAVIFILSGISASAETGMRYRFDDEYGNWITLGGINEWNGTKARSREETENLELTLTENGYMLISGNDMSISMSEYTQFLDERTFWFSRYMKKQEPDWNLYKVYVYEPSFRDYQTQISGKIKEPERYTIQELSESTVVIDYKYWDMDEAVGTISYNFNDNIPDYCESGYIQIRSQVDCEVTLLQAYTRQYYQFYIKKNQPLLVRVVTGCYHITSVNEQSINDNISNSGEDTLPYNNQIQIGTHHTIDNPYSIELFSLVSKYNIPDANIDGKPDYSLSTTAESFTDTDIPDEQTELSEKKADSLNHEAVFLWIILLALAVIGITWIIQQIRKGARNADRND